MNSNSMHSGASWSRRRAAVLTSLLSAVALGWTAVALSVHMTGSPALDPESVTDADVARLGAAVMAGSAAVAAGLWWRHWATVRRRVTGGGWARAAFVVSAVHSMFVVPVIVFASWEWTALVIAYTCAVFAGGVREAAGVTAPARTSWQPRSAR
ncbi:MULTISPECIES: hypothetical protein [Streptomyces]|uniref:Uncharacterized protein n=1 Tax=Streptomyces bugieae TaxID=3098223 RepID=A0ABU7NP37_9ACTN|nr:hypothetical protein [Streptomyces nigrescens]MEE4420619.1 hypothetical protein [Streptomyces sp. DSM 41528]